MTHTFDWTLETDDGEISLSIDYSYRGGSPAITSGPPEMCDPGEPDEVEIDGVWTDLARQPDHQPWHGQLCLMPDEEQRVIDHILENPPEDDGPDYDFWDDRD